MLPPFLSVMLYGTTFLSLFLVDYILGNGFVDIFHRVVCKIVCFVRKSIREEKHQGMSGDTISLPVLISEITFLGLTMMFLNKFREMRANDRLDNLIQESKDALEQANEFVEKWRIRKINWQVPSDYSYLDEEPQHIKPLKLEVPILHMAIIDTLGARNQFERGDVGDNINLNDSTILSITSLADDSTDSIPEEYKDIGQSDRIEFNNRFLWDVMEEDSNVED